MRLPDDAWTRTTPESRRQLRQARAWPLDAELLSQAIEEISVLAADHRRKKPRTVTRPDKPARRGDTGGRGAVDEHHAGAVSPAIAAMKGAARTVYRRADGA